MLLPHLLLFMEWTSYLGLSEGNVAGVAFCILTTSSPRLAAALSPCFTTAKFPSVLSPKSALGNHCLWVLQVLNPKFPIPKFQVGCTLHSLGLHIVGVQESHEDSRSVIQVPGFRWFGKPRQGRSKGGMGFLVLEALISEIEIFSDDSHLESIWLRLKGNRGQCSWFIGCVYMAPSPAAFEDDYYSKLLDDIAGFQQRGQVSVLGDFNARVGRAQQSWKLWVSLGFRV